MVVDALNFSFWSDLEVGLEETNTAGVDHLRANKYGVLYKGVLYQGYWALPALVNRGKPLCYYCQPTWPSER